MAYNNNYNNDYNNYNNDPYNNNQYYDNNQYNNQYNQYNGSYNNYNYTDPQFVEANKKRNKRNTARQNAEYLEQYRMMQSQNNYNNYNNYNNNYNNNGPVIRPKKNTKFVADNRLVRLIVFGVILLIAIIVGITILIINLTSSSGTKENTVVTNTEVVDNDYQTIGNNSLGYLTIPSDWVKFQDAKGSVRGLQYSDITTAYILTMDALSASEVDAETWAKAKATEFQKLGVKDVKGSKVKIGGYEAYQVYGYYEPAKKWLSIWCFQVDKIIHYIGIEGPDNTSEYFKMVNTFKATNTTNNTNTNTTNTNTQKK